MIKPENRHARLENNRRKKKRRERRRWRRRMSLGLIDNYH